MERDDAREQSTVVGRLESAKIERRNWLPVPFSPLEFPAG